MYSIHVLTSHLNECNKLGVADQGFILHGVKVLAGLLMDPEPTSSLLLSACLSSLLNFLQGNHNHNKMTAILHAANKILERPFPSPPPPYIEEPKKLALRLFDIIDEIQTLAFPARVAPPSMFMHAELTKLAYCVILQLARTDGLWPEIKDEERFVSAHKTILLSRHSSVSRVMAPVMCEFVKEKPELATGSYLRTLVALLPDAMRPGSNTVGFFMLFRELLLADHKASDSDENLRAIIETLVQQMWQYRHTETPDNAIQDETFMDFLGSLSYAIDLLKRFKQPLRLGGLAIGIFNRLLFCDADSSDVAVQTTSPDPSNTANLVLRMNETQDDDAETSSPDLCPTKIQSLVCSDSAPTPLYHVQSRVVCMEMVRMLCDNAEAYQWLVDRLSNVLDHGPLYAAGTFPTNHFIRAPDACSGLSNLGMTCYMNSLLQQIFSNIHFRHFVFETPTASSEPDLLWHVKKLFAEMQDSNVQVVDTQELAKYLNISVDNQEDVHGFYTIFMSALEQCLPDSNARSTFNRMFSGRLATQVQGSCGHVSSRTEPFSDLSITVQNKASLADSLAEFVQGEPMQGANKYKCLSCDAENGGKLVDAMRRTCLDDVPDHLNVCLKRFTFDMMGQESKNNDFFEFPEQIDLSKYERKSLENPNIPAQPDIFKLVGVIVHSGILTFGHYWSYVRLRYPNARISKWVRLEDGHTRQSNGFEEVQQECFGGNNRNHNGYVLFYQRESSFAKSSALMADLPQGVSPQAGLPPRVPPPDDLYRKIHQGNVERHRIAQPFDEGVFKLIVDLLGDFPPRSSSYGAEGTQPPNPDSEQMDHEQGDVPQDAQICDSLARLAFNFLNQVLLGERVQPKMLQFLEKFKGLAVRNVKLARRFIARVSDNPDFFLRILDHDDAETRYSVRHFLKDCLFSIKEPEPQIYASELKKFVKSHASLLKVMGPRYHNWFDYFSLAYDVKFNGVLEQSVVLNAGYLTWILEVAMDVPLNPLAHQDQQVLFDASRKKRVDFWPLFQFLQLFMEQGGAFKDFDHFSPGRYWHPARAVMELTGRNDAPRLTWMLLAARDHCQPPTPLSNTPAMIVHEMAGSDQRFYPILITSLSSILRTESSVSNSLFPMVSSLIAAMGDCNVSSRILSSLIDAVKRSERSPSYRMGLDGFSAIAVDAPRTVLRAIPHWAPEWLHPDNKVPKATQKWLQTNLFAATPLNKIPGDREVFGTAMDILRSQVVRQLSGKCKDLLMEAHDVDEGISYPQMTVVLEESFQYLSNLTTMCASAIEQAWRLGEQERLRAERAIGAEAESAEADDEDQMAPAPIVPKFSEGMKEEYKLAREAQQVLGSVLQDLQSPWLEDDEQVEDEGDSSAFEETEDEA
jgi:ubiquitin carboxyl-terminal hydrolase 34